MLSDYAAAHGKSQRFVGIPKTVDNDLPVTDHCPGYGSAAKYIAASMKEVIRDVQSTGLTKPTVLIVEIMGRHAGWLAAAAALAKGRTAMERMRFIFPRECLTRRIFFPISVPWQRQKTQW